jgi:hypothetical protein
MVSSRHAGRTLSSLLLCLGAVAGCGAGGASGAPDFDDGPPSTTTPPAVLPPGPSTPGVLPPSTGAPPGSLGESPPVPSVDLESCLTVSSQVELVKEAVDIIVAIDNSGSMDDESRAIEQNINVNFANILEQSAIDFRVIVVSEHRESDGQDTAVCIASPLSSIATCPSEEPGPSERFFHYATEINSRNSFDILLETYDGEREDDFGLAPNGWSEWLRPQAKKVFLEITDDNANTPALEFASALTALAPDQFGSDPSQLAFVWHSIVGLAERPVATDPYAPSDPVEDEECTGDVFNAGTIYQELSRLTGGLRFPICEFAGYDAVFRRIADDVVLRTGGSSCDFEIPAPPSGRMLDLDKVAVSYQRGGGGAPLLLGRATSEAQCGPDAFVVDGVGVHLCPQACELVGADVQASVDVLFTCESTLLR